MAPITDMLNRIKNAQAVLHKTVDISFSNLKYEIAKILERKGFVERIEVKGRKKRRTIKIVLKYDGEKQPVISGLKRISKSGQRIYKSYREMRRVKGGYGMAIVSTSKGIMTDQEARKKKLGGEVICEIW